MDGTELQECGTQGRLQVQGLGKVLKYIAYFKVQGGEPDVTHHTSSHESTCKTMMSRMFCVQSFKPTRKHSRTLRKAPRITPTMTPTILRDDRWVLLLLSVVLPSVLSVLSTDTETVAFKSLVPAFPAKSRYVPADRMHLLVRQEWY